MPILSIRDQQQVREIGRIRMGDKKPTSSGGSRPNKLDKFRITTQDKVLAEAIAAKYGGTPKLWKPDPKDPQQWEVYVEADEIPVLVAPNQIDQWYEQWNAGGCTHRCDGEWNQITDKPCSCDPDNRTCKTTTRAWFMLPEIAGLGTFRLESHGYYAAIEVTAAIDLVRNAQGRGAFIPCSIAIEHRERSLIKNGKPETRKYIVPVIRLRQSLNNLLAIAGQPTPSLEMATAPALNAPAPALPPREMSEAGKALVDAANVFLDNIQATEDERKAFRDDCKANARSWSKFAVQARDAGVTTMDQFRAYYVSGEVPRTNEYDPFSEPVQPELIKGDGGE